MSQENVEVVRQGWNAWLRASTMIAVTLAVFVGCGGSSGTGGGNGQSGGSASSSIEYKLASVDTGARLNPGDPIIAEYGDALDSLQQKCKDSRNLLAKYSLKAKQVLRKKGVDLSAFAVLRAVDGSIPSAAPKMPCVDTFAPFVR
jgi:hypothetical protein